MKIRFEPNNITLDAKVGDTVLQTAINASITIEADCFGEGTCGKCKVKILAGDLGEPDEVEKSFLTEDEIKNGIRLACRVRVTDNLVIKIPERSVDQRKKDLVWLPENFVHDKKEASKYGVAFDIGTTTVVGMLWDLEEGKLINSAARTNPQTTFGADVISRILFTKQEDGNLELMQEKILEALNNIILEFNEKEGISPKDICYATAVGNTTMSHLLLAIDPIGLAMVPFEPGFTGHVEIPASKLGLNINHNAKVIVLPNIAGHVGSDIVAVMVASDIKKLEGANLAIDIGTNGEIVLAYKGEILACSTAAGPAFEGASIRQGMRATKGAIERVKISEDRVQLSVIENATPIGICGSGLIECVSEILKLGLISENGRMLDKEEAKQKGYSEEIYERLRKGENGNEFVLYWGKDSIDVTLTQKDVREVQLAKAAIAAGINILMNELEIEPSDLNNIFLAGAFGNYIDKDSAITIGLLPNVPKDKVVSIGNAAGAGVSMALLSESTLKHAFSLAETSKHIELASNPNFQKIYLENMYFKKEN
jgi:uncharacterized 2Fe-2S/4Fe-4S cluster protein (DUF4445 family)